MVSLSTLAHSNAVAPPGRRDRADMSSLGMPVRGSSRFAEWRSALVMCRAVTLYQRRCFGCGLKWWYSGVLGSAL